MNLFNFLKKKELSSTNDEQKQQNETETSSALLHTKETEQNHDKESNLSLSYFDVNNGIDAVYSFLQANYETKGYNDSFVNPDSSYKADNIKLIKFDLQILIEKTDAYYDNLVSEINYHIATRHKAGLDDLVQELEARKKLVDEYKQKLQYIKESINNEDGMCQRIILSYQRGFMRGLSVLTQSNILSKKL